MRTLSWFQEGNMARRSKPGGKPFLLYFNGISKMCEAAAEQIDAIVTTHTGEEGRLFEEVLRQVLSRFLPRKYAIGSGFQPAGQVAGGRREDPKDGKIEAIRNL
jgi:hypothetical protein